MLVCVLFRLHTDDAMLHDPHFNYVYVGLHHYITTTKGDASVCLCAKFDQFLPVRSHFDTKRPVNSVRIATFQCAKFGPLLFAFY